MTAPSLELLARVRASSSVLLTGPEGPDGDSIGACLALRRLLLRAAPGVRVDVACRLPRRYSFLPDAEACLPETEGPYDGVVVLDGDATRLVASVSRLFQQARWTCLIDHHRSTSLEAYSVVVFDPDSESTCGMIWKMAKDWSIPLERETAIQLYTGVIFDTGNFRYANTKVGTHQMAAELLSFEMDHSDITRKVLLDRRPAGLLLMGEVLKECRFLAEGRVVLGVCSLAQMQPFGAESEDVEGIVDMLQHVSGVEMAVLVVEKSPERVKLSLRSAGTVDVAALAKSLDAGGGGHTRAAGTSIRAPLARVLEGLPARLVAALP